MDRRLAFILVPLLVAQLGKGQGFLRPNEWKKYRKEVFISLGSSHFLGDLGGRDREGTTFGPADLDITQTRTAFAIGGRYKLAKVISVAAKLSYISLKGSDAATEDDARHNRNLNFKSDVYELTVRGEYGWQSLKRGTSRYGIKQSYGKLKNITHEIFGFGGLGIFYFNPRGLTPEGHYVNLYNLHTEGQGLPGGPKQYKRVAMNLLLGGYYRFTLNKMYSFGIELGYRKTFSDYIDDVGGVYYNKQALGEAYGPLSAYMSDPNLGLIKGATSPAADGTPAQRGDSNMDAYFTVEFTAGYTFKQKKKSARLRSKF